MPREIPRMYMHDVRLGNGAIVSYTCTGATCEFCAKDPQAAERAQNPYFPRAINDRSHNPNRPQNNTKRGPRKR